MSSIVKIIISLTILFSTVATAKRPIDLSLTKKPIERLRHFFSGYGYDIKKWGVSMVVACSLMTSGCNSTISMEERVSTVNYEDVKDNKLKDILTELELTDHEIGVIRITSHNIRTLNNSDNTSFQLLEGDVLINNEEFPLEVIYSKESFDTSLIHEGSLLAIIPAIAIASGTLIFTGYAITIGRAFYGENWSKAVLEAVTGVTASAILGAGTYYLLLLL